MRSRLHGAAPAPHGNHRPDGDHAPHGNHRLHDGDPDPHGNHRLHDGDPDPHGNHRLHDGDPDPHGTHRPHDADRDPHGNRPRAYRRDRHSRSRPWVRSRLHGAAPGPRGTRLHAWDRSLPHDGDPGPRGIRRPHDADRDPHGNRPRAYRRDPHGNRPRAYRRDRHGIRPHDGDPGPRGNRRPHDAGHDHLDPGRNGARLRLDANPDRPGPGLCPGTGARRHPAVPLDANRGRRGIRPHVGRRGRHRTDFLRHGRRIGRPHDGRHSHPRGASRARRGSPRPAAALCPRARWSGSCRRNGTDGRHRSLARESRIRRSCRPRWSASHQSRRARAVRRRIRFLCSLLVHFVGLTQRTHNDGPPWLVAARPGPYATKATRGGGPVSPG